jgi:predicted Ser/Thr protein kinase
VVVPGVGRRHIATQVRKEWHRVRDLFERALAEQPGDIDAWLEREAPDEPNVRAEIKSLLDHHSHAGEFLDEPVADRFPALLDDAPSYAPGQVIGPYTIVRELGRGGMGRVYLAQDARLGRAVALKAIAPRLTSEPSNRERLRREARAAAGLTDPGICTVYALEEHDGELFIAAEYIEGRTLRDEIASGQRPSAADIVGTARGIAAALASAHGRGVIHRDLKPENVMRTRDGRVKILDFGLARTEVSSGEMSAGHLTQTGVIVGTPGYMAPEQLKGERVDIRVDVFAFGVVLYEYACGVHPFAAESALGMAARVLESNAAPLQGLCPALPIQLAAVIERCLRKAPGERYGSASELVGALSASDQLHHPPVIQWWRAHQMVVTGLYFVAAAVAWWVKEVQPGGALVVFIVIAVAATVAGIFRGHVLFTERMNPKALSSERRRADQITLVVDLLIFGALIADTVLLWADPPVTAVLIACLGVGIGLARLVIEPATTTAAFP